MVWGLVLAVGIGGCSLFGGSPQPEVVVAKPAEPEYPTYLLLRLAERRVYLMESSTKQPIESFKVAIGRKPWETPTGTFAVQEMVENPDFVRFDWKNPKRVFGRIPPGPKNPLGLRWIGFASAHGWDIGFHGTTGVHLLGQAVSHGCVRMRNDDVVKVFAQVKIGTPVIVEP